MYTKGSFIAIRFKKKKKHKQNNNNNDKNFYCQTGRYSQVEFKYNKLVVVSGKLTSGCSLCVFFKVDLFTKSFGLGSEEKSGTEKQVFRKKVPKR